jgi:hypothetical protein
MLLREPKKAFFANTRQSTLWQALFRDTVPLNKFG